MKFQRSTVVLVASALLLGGLVLLSQAPRSGSNRSTTEQADSETSPVYDFAEADVVTLQIETRDQTVAFEKDDAGFWQMVDPEAHPAEEAAIAFLLSRLVTDGLLKTTTIDAANQAEFGLDDPFAIVDLTLADGTSHTFILGDADFSNQNYYALIDPDAFPLPVDAGEVEVAIVTQNIRNGVDRPLEEWQAIVETAPEDDSGTEADEDPDENGDETSDEVDGATTDAPDADAEESDSRDLADPED